MENDEKKNELNNIDEFDQDLENEEKSLSDLRNTALGKEQTKPDATDKKDNTESVDEGKEKKEEKAEVKETQEDKKPAQPSDQKPDELVEITDEYISSQPENLREYLKGIKGEKLTNKVLKNYLNSQEFIKNQKETFRTTTPVDRTKLEKQVESVKVNMLFTNLKSKIPELPPNFFNMEQEERNEWVRDYDYNHPLEKNFKDVYFSELENVDKQTKEYVDLQTSWQDRFKATVLEDIKAFRTRLESYGVKESDLGIEINEDYLQKFLFDETGKPKSLVSYDRGVAEISPGKILQALIDENFDRIIELREKAAEKKGFLKRTSQEDNPSLSGAGVTGKKTEEKETLTIDDDLDEEESSKRLKKLREKAMQS